MYAENMAQIWSKPYDIDRAYFWELQDSVAQDVAKILDTKLTFSEQLITSKRPDNNEAYEYYMQGEYMKKKYVYATENVDDFYNSEQMYKEAIKLDTNYTLAYVGLSDLYQNYICYPNSEEKSAYNLQIDKYIEIAFQLDPNIAELNTLRGIRLLNKGDIDGAFDLIKRAVEVDPKCVSANVALFEFFRFDLKYINKAIELDPLDPTLYVRRAEYYYMNGQFEKVDHEFQKAFNITPGHSYALLLRLYYLIAIEEYDEIRRIYTNKMNLYANFSDFVKKVLYAVNGDNKKALENITDLDWYQQVYIYSILGMDEEIINVLNKVPIENYPYYRYLKSNPMLDNIRTDTRFQNIMAQSKEINEKNIKKYGD